MSTSFEGSASPTSSSSSIEAAETVYFKTAAICWSPGYRQFDDYNDCYLPTPIESWGENVDVLDESGQRLVSLPLPFLQQGGVASVRYALEMVHLTFEEQGHLTWPGDTRQRAESHEELSSPTILTFIRNDGLKDPCTPRVGPSFRFPYGLINYDDHFQLKRTEENEERWLPTAEISEFRRRVWNRDRAPLLEFRYPGHSFRPPDHNDDYQIRSHQARRSMFSTEAIHFVGAPISQELKDELRLDIPAIQPIDRQPHLHDKLNHPSSGLVLHLNWHLPWVQGNVALYPLPDSDEYMVHEFTGDPIHGKRITRERFHCEDEDLPDRTLVMYHYQQCAMKMLRGYAHGLESYPEGFEGVESMLLGGDRDII